jgi:hypothetical protein
MQGVAWTTGLSIALFWLPVIGPAIAGFVGGRYHGSPGAAVGFALLPALLLAVLILLVLGAFDLPVIGAIAGVGVFVAVAVQNIPLVVGAYAGGTAAQR